MMFNGGRDVRAETSDLKTVVTFGTSLTAIGGWQKPLEAALSACRASPVSVKTVALSGARSSWGLTQIETVAELRPDVVVIEFYANDATLHRFVTVSQSSANLAAILSGLRARLPEARLVLQIMNPISGIRGMIRPFLDDYIDAHSREGHGQGADIVDHRPAWAALSEQERAIAIPDGAHPVPEVASRIIVPALARTIGGAGC